MERYSIMVVGAETSPVRRFHVAKQTVRRLVWAGGVAALLLLVGMIDYVRVRIDQLELSALRMEVTHQRQQIEAFEATLSDVETRLARIREFERKVRTIANLPGALSEGGEDAISILGAGGRLIPADALQDAPLPVRVGSVALEASEQGGGAIAASAPQPSDLQRLVGGGYSQVDVIAERGLRQRAQRLGELAATRQESLAEVVLQLQDKRQKLASTPSIWPARGWLTSTFGHRISPFTGRRQFHGGIDVAGARGTDVITTAGGKVTFVGKKGPLGNTVVVDHGYGMRSLYGHNAEVFVKRGDVIERGTRIATIGSSGRSTGPHLHYVVEVNGRAVNPLNYIFE